MRGAKPKLVVDNGAVKRNAPAPSWMSAEAKREWRRVMPLLVERRISDRSTARLEQDYAGLMERLAQANAQYAPGVVGNMGVQIDPSQQAEIQAQANAMRAELKRRALAKLANDLNTPKAPAVDDDGDGGGRNKAADAAIKQGEAVKALIANLQHEQDQLGRTAHEQELYNALKSVGVTAESEFGQQIAATLGPLQEQRDAIAANAEMMSVLGDIGMAAMDGIIGALADGKIEADEFGAILSDVLGMAGQFFLNQAFGAIGGGGGGFNIGKLFGFAKGTANTGGQRGEPRGVVHGQEAVIPLPDGGKVPVQIAGAAGPSATSQTFAPVININGSGLTQVEMTSAIGDALDRYDRFTAPATFRRIQNDPLARG